MLKGLLTMNTDEIERLAVIHNIVDKDRDHGYSDYAAEIISQLRAQYIIQLSSEPAGSMAHLLSQMGLVFQNRSNQNTGIHSPPTIQSMTALIIKSGIFLDPYILSYF